MHLSSAILNFFFNFSFRGHENHSSWCKPLANDNQIFLTFSYMHSELVESSYNTNSRLFQKCHTSVANHPLLPSAALAVMTTKHENVLFP